jgi:hypothetical protein
MFLSKKHLSRRTLLRGAGATLALPFLDAMIPALARGETANPKPPTRFTGIFIPHGAAPGYWEVKDTKPNFDYPFIWKPLEPFRKNVLLTTGMWSQSAEAPPGVTGQDHFVAASFMAAVKPKKTEGADVQVGTTIDQLIAQKVGKNTLLPSLQFALEDPGANSSSCGEGYSCVYTNTISWEAPNRPLPMELNPQVVFERMFGSGGSEAVREARRARQVSILDSVTDSLASLRRSVGGSDRARIDQYLENIREIERRMEIAAKNAAATPDIDVPYGVPATFDEHVKIHSDLLTLAFQADITRVGSMLFARDLTGRVYPESGVNISFHGGSHHAEDPGRIAQYAQLNQYHAKCVAYFINKLASTPDGDGTLLDHSLTLYGSDMGDSNQHLHYDTPQVLIGGAGGKLKGDRHLAFKQKTVPTGNLLLSVLDMYDIHMESFGDSTGRLPGLEGV